MKTYKMKKSMFIIGGLLISSGILFGQMMHKKNMQRNKDPKEMVKFVTKKMVKRLNLNESQATKLEEINLKHFNKMNGIKESHRTELESILNKEQLAKLDKSPFGKRFGQGFGPMGGNHPGFGPMGGGFGHPGFMKGNHHRFGPMMGFGPNPEMMEKMHGKMEKMFEKISEERKDFDKKLSTSEKEIIVKFKENMERPDWDEDISMEDRKAKMEKRFQPILDIANNHKSDLELISKKIEKEIPFENDFMDCMKNSDDFKKMKQVRFLMMEF